MKRTRIVLLLVLIATTALAAVGLQSSSSPAANTAFFNTFSSLRTYIGRSERPTYTCTINGVALTAALSMSLESEVSRGFHIARICWSTSNATAAALQTLTVKRQTAASTGGSVVSAEGTGTSAVSQHVPGTGNWGGICRTGGTAGTAGALLDSAGWTIGEIAAGTADPPGPDANCREYGMNGTQMPYVPSGVANGVDVRIGAAGAGALSVGTLSITFIAE
jgi:hypothetical protein